MAGFFDKAQKMVEKLDSKDIALGVGLIVAAAVFVASPLAALLIALVVGLCFLAYKMNEEERNPTLCQKASNF